MLDKLNVIKFLEKYTYYPKEYNPRVHGPFVHYRNYGKRKKRVVAFSIYEILYSLLF